MEIKPWFFDRFQCKAGACGHTCCGVWEIDIDAESLKKYQACKGELGDELRSHIEVESDCAYFRLNGKNRCFFLNEQGLCRLILEKGEDFICDICTLHPRFFFDFEGDSFSGVGLCCERTVELLFEKDLYFVGDGNNMTLDEIVCDEVSEFKPELTESELEFILDVMGETDPIDEEWAAQLDRLSLGGEALLSEAGKLISDNAEKAECIYKYILYRQIELLEDYELSQIERYAATATEFIFLLKAGNEDMTLTECVLRWSQQIEYDTDNVEICLNKM